MKIHFLNHLFGWWSHHQCFTMFPIRSVVQDATLPLVLQELSSLEIEQPEGVAERRGRQFA